MLIWPVTLSASFNMTLKQSETSLCWASSLDFLPAFAAERRRYLTPCSGYYASSDKKIAELNLQLLLIYRHCRPICVVRAILHPVSSRAGKQIQLGRIAAINSCPRCGCCYRCSVVCLCVCVRHIGEPCKNGWTDRHAVRGVDLCGPKKPCSRCMGASISSGKGQYSVFSGPLTNIVRHRMSKCP